MAAKCPWPCMVTSFPVKNLSLVKSFAQVVNDACEVKISQLPSSTIKGESLCIKITQGEYDKGLVDCRKNLHMRVLLNIGEKPLTARDLRDELKLIWKTSCPWKLVSLGRGVYEFKFGSYEDIRLAWSM
ncbi:NBS resistance protein, partial [Trifolium medium]|nr:NBS resistance protein [Trifolium medium]